MLKEVKQLVASFEEEIEERVSSHLSSKLKTFKNLQKVINDEREKLTS